VILRNDECRILKSFAVVEQTPAFPASSFPPELRLDRRGYGCDAARVDDIDAIKRAAAAAWSKNVPTVLESPIFPQVPLLI